MAREVKRIAVLVTAIFIIGALYPNVSSGQILPEEVVLFLESEAEKGGTDIESMVEYCERFVSKPINLNTASRGDLLSFPLFTLFQVESIIDYRENYGNIVTFSELELIDGFSAEKVKLLSPFITLGSTDGRLSNVRDSLPEHSLKIRAKCRFQGETPLYFSQKYKMTYASGLEVGCSFVEEVNGGGIVDYAAGHLAVSDIKVGREGKWRIKSGVIGDFTVRLGQGLVGWNSFSLSGEGSPESVLKRSWGIFPYTSTSESNFCRGAGGVIAIGNWGELTAFYSNRGRGVAGGAFSIKRGTLKVGANTFYTPDNMNTSADFLLSIGRYRAFGEVAVDKDFDISFIIGAILPLSDIIESSVTIRGYSPDYSAPYSGGYSSLSRCYNQYGVTLNLYTQLSEKGSLSIISDGVYYPAPRYGVKTPSSEVEVKGVLEWNFSEGISAYLKGNYRYYGAVPSHKVGVRGHFLREYPIGVYWSVRGEVVHNSRTDGEFPLGIAAYGECGYVAPSRRWEVAIRGTMWRVDDWENRIYFYQRDLPQSFSVPALYKRGWDVYGFAKYTPTRTVSLYLKISLKEIRSQVNLLF